VFLKRLTWQQPYIRPHERSISVLILNVQQNSPEWFAARLGRPTGSVYSDVLARGKDGGKSVTRQKLVVKLALELVTGKPAAQIFQNQAMKDGTEREPIARALYEASRGVFIEEVGFCQHDTIFTGVSPDGFVGDGGMVEFKCPIETTHRDYMRLEAGKCPSEYRWQVLGQLWVCEREWCDFASYSNAFPDNSQLIVRRIYRDEAAIKLLEQEVIKFNAEVQAEAEAIRNYREAA
jgi:putative phage-type endonuclease